MYLRYFCAYDVNRIDSVYGLRVSKKKKFKINLTADDNIIYYYTISKHACCSVFFQTENKNVYHNIIYYMPRAVFGWYFKILSDMPTLCNEKSIISQRYYVYCIYGLLCVQSTYPLISIFYYRLSVSAHYYTWLYYL